MKDDSKEFENQVNTNILNLKSDGTLKDLSRAWLNQAALSNYTYNFRWMNRPIIQIPQDIIAIHEIIWQVKPTLVIETGIARGGSILFTASQLALLDLYESTIDLSSETFSVKPQRKVIGIDIDIREHNKKALVENPLNPWITLIEGSSIDPEIIDVVSRNAADEKVLVILDSNHTHQHVLEELKSYSKFVSEGSYCIVLDTVIEYMPDDLFPDRDWGVGDNPLTAVNSFLSDNHSFEIDEQIDAKLCISVGPKGFLKKIS